MEKNKGSTSCPIDQSADHYSAFDSSNKVVDWLELPELILSLVAQKFQRQKDFIRFGAVCQSWRSIFKYLQSQATPRLPLLMLATELNRDSQTRSFYSLTEKKVCNSQVPVAHHKFCPGSSHGWIVTVSEDKQVSLFNPFISVDNEIHLPPLTAFESHPNGGIPSHLGFLRKAVLSANPIHNPSYVVMAIYSACSRLAFFRPGDKAWTSLNSEIGGFVDVIYCRDRFYGVKRGGVVYSCDFDHPQPQLSKVAPPLDEGADSRYLVESSGDLLQILRFTLFADDDFDENHVHDYNYFNGGFEVYKLDPVELKWIQLDNLDGRLIFVGDNCSICLRASDFPECEPNSIYFTDDYYEGYFRKERYGIGPHDLGFFSFEDGMLGKYYPTTSNMIYPAPIWVEPPP